MEKHFIQTFDYLNNEHFETNSSANNFTISDNVQINELINSIDATINFITESAPTNPIKKFYNSSKIHLDQLNEILNQKTQNDSELNTILEIIQKEATRLVEKYIKNTTSDQKKIAKKYNIKSDSFHERLSILKENGFLEYNFEENLEFRQWSETQLALAREKYKQEEDWRGANAYDNDSEIFKIIEKFISENKILELISSYKKMDMEVFYAAWDYSHARQKWFRHNHEYDYIAPTNYYHFDADEDVAKMLIYLTDVTENDGPFKFVKGSNTMSRSIFLTCVYQAIDSIISPKFAKKDNLYGRGLFLYRKDLLMKFPDSFIGTTHFGDDLIEASPLSSYLLNNTTTFIRKKGSAILFDGFKGIHAGGNASKGERLAVQVAFRKKSFSQEISITSRIKRKIKGILSNK